MTGAAVASVEGWIFRWDNHTKQTANITGLESGAKYLIKLPTTNKGEATVTKLNI